MYEKKIANGLMLYECAYYEDETENQHCHKDCAHRTIGGNCVLFVMDSPDLRPDACKEAEDIHEVANRSISRLESALEMLHQ
jgi:hypothetical protein